MRFVVALMVAVACACAQAQPTRVRGTISGFDGKTLTIDGKTKVLVGERTEIVFTQPITLAEIKPGDFLGVTSRKGPGGQLTAYEVRRFPKPLNPGHRPFDGRDDQTMTNATVGAMVQATSGRELTMTYEGGSQKIAVPENASISALIPGTPKQLVPGAPVSLTHDADKVALRIQVGPPRL
jgi:hypothetical protein